MASAYPPQHRGDHGLELLADGLGQRVGDERLPGPVGEVAGERLGEATRPALLEHGADAVGSVGVELRRAEERLDRLPARLRHRVGEQYGALALAEVADRGLAGVAL